jgi:hypothetical protein
LPRFLTSERNQGIYSQQMHLDQISSFFQSNISHEANMMMQGLEASSTNLFWSNKVGHIAVRYKLPNNIHISH